MWRFLRFLKNNNASKRRIKDWEYNLLKTITTNLPQKYFFLRNQFNEDFFIDSLDNELLKDNWKRSILNQNLYKSYQNKAYNLLIQDIKVFDVNNGSYISVDIDVFEGIIIGYKINSDSDLFDIDRIDYQTIKEVKYDTFNSELSDIFSNNEKELLKINGFYNIYEIELENRVFYHFLDLDNGDLVALDKNGDLYFLLYNPFSIIFFCCKHEMFEKIKNDTLESEILTKHESIEIKIIY